MLRMPSNATLYPCLPSGLVFKYLFCLVSYEGIEIDAAN